MHAPAEAGSALLAYAYDKTGDTTGRPNGTDSQTLTWNPTGELDTLTEKSSSGTTKSTTSHIYEADGNLLIRRNTGGESVLCPHYLWCGSLSDPAGVRRHAVGEGGDEVAQFVRALDDERPVE
jgi:hypothetical protein